MKVVLDTNVLLVSLPKQSPFRIIFDELLNGKFELLISNEIVSEYLEIIERKTNQSIAKNVVEAVLNLPNSTESKIFYQWGLITKDPDDNKFVDLAISGNADFIVTNDKHFDILKTLDFPKVKSITINEFKAVLNLSSK
jgi:putative PIN family toxin of toxin-antitoxin system|tara:strand:- start:241 stop:657 length:417 start_codon:yes stop_codon:yes gene_type:complete